MKKYQEFIRFLPGVFLSLALLYAFVSIDHNLIGIINSGALYSPLVTDGEWWRLLSSLFIHDNIYLLLFMSICIAVFSPRLIQGVGLTGYALILLGSALVANAMSLMILGALLSFGSAAMVAGILGALILLPGEAGKFDGLKQLDKKNLIYKLIAIPVLFVLFYLSYSHSYVPLVSVAVGMFCGLIGSVVLLSRDSRNAIYFSSASLMICLLAIFMTKRQYNYLPTYIEYQKLAKSCLEKTEGLFEKHNQQKDSKVLANSSAMLSAILKTQCRHAVEKIPHVEGLASAYREKSFENTKKRVLFSTALLQAEIEIIYLKSLKARIKLLRDNNKWRQMVEILESATVKRPAKIGLIIDSLKTVVPVSDIAEGQEKLRLLIAAMQYYQSRSNELRQLRELNPEGKGDAKLSVLKKRFYEKSKSCEEYVENIEMEKSYYFPDYEKQLENIIKESCRPALFLSEKLVAKALSEPRKRHWRAENKMARKRIWRVHATLEVIRLKELKHLLGKYKYQGDQEQLAKLRSGALIEGANKVRILIDEYREKYLKRSTARDQAIRDRLVESLADYKSVNSSKGRTPASRQ